MEGGGSIEGELFILIVAILDRYWVMEMMVYDYKKYVNLLIV